ncbi:acyl-[acyl-carrier-protein] thioesterase [Chakrabartyella piscis]|uniref:acyl-[acyl-carrier-protein] thioesterase n=1 Tax=Chakrabartyella piscis TaxID=2918914 RepID=UPI0029584DFC|nr:acyl-ACP thioesterase domain-containing protein [Chakrabartyella piscis]
MENVGYRKQKQVSYQQLDTMGRMTPAAVLLELQEAGIAHSDKLGFDFQYLASAKRGWAVINWHIIIHKIPRANETTNMFTWNDKIKRMQASRSYCISDDRGNTMIEAISRWVFLDLETRHPSTVPQEMIDKYHTGLEPSIPNEKYVMAKPNLGEEITTREFLVTRRDTDSNGHANNVKYLEWAMDDVADEIYEDMDLFDIRIIYRKECRRGEVVQLKTFVTEQENHTEVISLLLDVEGKTIAEVVTLWQ